MPREQIEFVIRTDGTVEEHLQGFAGDTCDAVTAPIEQRLGAVVSRDHTPERFTSPTGTAAETQRADEQSH